MDRGWAWQGRIWAGLYLHLPKEATSIVLLINNVNQRNGGATSVGGSNATKTRDRLRHSLQPLVVAMGKGGSAALDVPMKTSTEKRLDALRQIKEMQATQHLNIPPWKALMRSEKKSETPPSRGDTEIVTISLGSSPCSTRSSIKSRPSSARQLHYPSSTGSTAVAGRTSWTAGFNAYESTPQKITTRRIKPDMNAARVPSADAQQAREETAQSRERARRAELASHVIACRGGAVSVKVTLRDNLVAQISERDERTASRRHEPWTFSMDTENPSELARMRPVRREALQRVSKDACIGGARDSKSVHFTEPVVDNRRAMARECLLANQQMAAEKRLLAR